MRAHELLAQAQHALQDRAATRDHASERSMALTAGIFTTMTGKPMSELDGWRFMVALKLARAARGQCHADDWIDLAGYAALAGECQMTVPAAPEMDTDLPAHAAALQERQMADEPTLGLNVETDTAT